MSVMENINKDELVGKIHEMNENRIWLDKIISTIRNEYPDMYIAVFKKKIVGSDPDMKKLLIKMREKHGSLDTILIEFVSGEDYYLIL